MTAGTISHLIASVAFALLTVLLVLSRQRGPHGALLVVASAFSTVWAIDGFLPLDSFLPIRLDTGLTDTLRILSWGVFVHALIALGRRTGPGIGSGTGTAANEPYRPRLDGLGFPALALAILIVELTVPVLVDHGALDLYFVQIVLPSLWILAALASLRLVEELYRNTLPERRYAIRHLCIGLGAMFVFDFLVFTDTLLFRRVQPDLWQARGVLYTLLVPLVASSVGRNADWALRLHVSRGAVSGSVAVIGAGAYLLATALVGSLIRYSEVSWAGVAETVLVGLSIVLFVTLALSRRLRGRARVMLSKNLFTFKYDYRREWLTFTRTLARDPAEAPDAIVKGLTAIVESDAGALWGKDGNSQLELLAARGITGLQTVAPTALASLDRFLGTSGWLIDLDEFRAHPERYPKLELSREFVENTSFWLVVPLPFNDDVIGFALIARSRIMKRINWEDRDLLKTAGQQAAGLLAQRRAHEALVEARQFEAFSKLSAYIVHDLKNILGQQSLIVSNAAKHKHKPEFVDDAIATIENSVSRMHALLGQLRAERGDEKRVSVDVAVALQEAIASSVKRKPRPQENGIERDLRVRANRDKLVKVFAHLIQNAQEASSRNGSVEIALESTPGGARVRIADNGLRHERGLLARASVQAVRVDEGIDRDGHRCVREPRVRPQPRWRCHRHERRRQRNHVRRRGQRQLADRADVARQQRQHRRPRQISSQMSVRTDSLLIVEDDAGIRNQLKWALDGFDVALAENREEAIAQLRLNEPAIVLLDLGLPPDPGGASEGLAALEEIMELAPRTKVVVITGNDEREHAVRAIGLGAHDFYNKPIDAEVLNHVVDRARRVHELERENERLQRKNAASSSLDGIIAISESMTKVCRDIEKLAPSDIGTLLSARAVPERSCSPAHCTS